MKRVAFSAVLAFGGGLSLAWGQEKKNGLPPWLFLDQAPISSLPGMQERDDEPPFPEEPSLLYPLWPGKLSPNWAEVLLRESIQDTTPAERTTVFCFHRRGYSTRTCPDVAHPSCLQFIRVCLQRGGAVVIVDPDADSGTGAREEEENFLLPESESEARKSILPSADGRKPLRGPVLFPNPAQGTATLQMPHAGTWTARLYNTLGQLVATHPFEGTETVLTLPPQKGLYWVVVEGAGQTYRLPLLRE